MKHKQKKNQICKPMPNMQPITREKKLHMQLAQSRKIKLQKSINSIYESTE